MRQKGIVILLLTAEQVMAPGLLLPSLHVCLVNPQYTLAEVGNAIGQIEGFNQPGSLFARLHNPGGLVFAGQPDSRPGPRGFAEFSSDGAGWLASYRDLQAKADLVFTLPAICRLRAGPEDDPVSYARMLRIILETNAKEKNHVPPSVLPFWTPSHAAGRPSDLFRSSPFRGDQPSHN